MSKNAEISAQFMAAQDAMIAAHTCPECHAEDALVVERPGRHGIPVVFCTACWIVVSALERDAALWKQGKEGGSDVVQG